MQTIIPNLGEQDIAAASSPATRAIPLRRSSSSFSALQMGLGGLLIAKTLSYSVDIDS